MKFKILPFLLSCVLSTTMVLTGCAGSGTSFPTADQITATAEKIGSDTITYTQTLANMVQTVTSLAGVTAPAIEALANQWGLLPANSSQLATFNKVVNAITNANASATAVEALLTSLQTHGTVPATASTGGSYHYLGIADKDINRWEGGRA